MSEVRSFQSVLRQAAVTLLLAGGLALGGSDQAAALENGDFESGVLDPWTTFLTDNGTIGVPSIVDFDIDGSGLASSLALQLRTGQITHFTGLPPAGGGIEQIVSFNAGDLSISVDIAAVNPSTTDNLFGGFFELLFDGVALDTAFDVGFLAGGESVFGMLSGSVVGVTEGDHLVAVRVTRPRETSSTPPSATPLQYVDNVELSGSAVIPEPGSALLLAGALLGLATLRKRSRNRA